VDSLDLHCETVYSNFVVNISVFTRDICTGIVMYLFHLTTTDRTKKNSY